VDTETGAPAKPDEPQSPPESAVQDAAAAIDEGKGGRQMMFLACAMIVGGALMMGVLNGRNAGRAAAGTMTPTSTPATTPAAEKPLPPSAGWTENTSAWTAETRRRIAFELPARNETSVWMKTVRPLLVVRCQEGQMEAFVYTDSPAAMESQDEDHMVRISFDGEPGRTERWPDSSTHDALFAPQGAAFAARIMTAESLRFGYTPHNAAAVVAHFDVRGLAEKLRPAKACAAR
jgi:hypothetical protein